MKVLVTGANGFIGLALCKRLMADGYQVRGAVRGQEKTEVGSKRDERPTSNIERPTSNEKQKKQRSDVGGIRVEVGDIGPETDPQIKRQNRTQMLLPISAQDTFG